MISYQSLVSHPKGSLHFDLFSITPVLNENVFGGGLPLKAAENLTKEYGELQFKGLDK